MLRARFVALLHSPLLTHTHTPTHTWIHAHSCWLAPPAPLLFNKLLIYCLIVWLLTTFEIPQRHSPTTRPPQANASHCVRIGFGDWKQVYVRTCISNEQVTRACCPPVYKYIHILQFDFWICLSEWILISDWLFMPKHNSFANCLLRLQIKLPHKDNWILCVIFECNSTSVSYDTNSHLVASTESISMYLFRLLFRLISFVDFYLCTFSAIIC